MSKSNYRFLLRLFSIVLFISLLFSGTSPLGHTANAFARINTPEDISTQRELLQYTSAGHVLGFEPGGLYLATGSHMLRAEFVGTQGVTPIADQVPSADGQTQPLGSLSYPDLWPGITLTYDSPPGSILRSTYHIAAGANADQIHLRYNVPLHIDAGGNLNFVFETGTLTASAPVAWQEIDGQSIPVEVAFASLEPDNEISFRVGDYNPSLPLTIDPSLVWNTFLGSAERDLGYDIAVDSNSNVYVTGYSEATWGSPVNPYAGDEDAFVAKLDSSGNLLWNTFLGSAGKPGYTGDDNGQSIAVDKSGNVYVTGTSVITWGDPVNAHAGYYDVFVAKLSANDGTLEWNTFWSLLDNVNFGHAIACDGDGNTYVTGVTYTGAGDKAYVFKLNTNGVKQWDTYMGEGAAEGHDIAIDGNGNSYVVGFSTATWGDPVSPFTPDDDDAFVAKLNSSGTIQWNTFMGSENFDKGFGIALDGSGNICVSGLSYGSWGDPVNPYDENGDHFVAQLNSNGVRQWNTFLNTWNYNLGQDVAVDENDNIYLSGESYETWGSPLNPHAGGYDVYAVKLNNSGILQWNTFLGSEDDEYNKSIEVDTFGNIYMTGYSEATWGDPIISHPGGYYSIFVAKLGVAPEIDLQGNGQSIPDGDSSPASDDGSDFGLVPWDGGTLTHTFTIQNTGDADLNLTGTSRAEITGTHAGDFTVTAQPASSVAPGASTSFTVRFDPGAIGTRSATVSIASNDSNETPYNFAIQGTGAWAIYLPLVLR